MRGERSRSQGSLKNSSLSYWHRELPPPLTHGSCFSPPCRYSMPAQLPPRSQPSLLHPLFILPTKSCSQQLCSALPSSSLPPFGSLLRCQEWRRSRTSALAGRGMVSFLSLSSGAHQLQLFLCSPRKAESRGSEQEHSEVYNTQKWRKGVVCLLPQAGALHFTAE